MRKVFVGLSGGVDSAVSAALLKKQGYEVVGCFIKIWQPEFIECTWREDRLDAMRVAASLSIPFREIDLSDEYKREVVDTMARDYAHGITPNPDVLCNEKIKFGSFAQWAYASGADMIATGHYARIRTNNDLRNRYILERAKDVSKDQSYFLYRLNQGDLARVLFPVGGYSKSRVRSLAKSFNLPVADKPDSQGLCFVGDVSLQEFLARFIPLTSGAVLNMKGEVIGEHNGAALYTIGQRHGYTVHKSTSTGAHYVVSVDTKHNTVTVSENRSDAERKIAYLEHVHWIGHISKFPLATSVQARYRETTGTATIQEENGRIVVRTKEPHIFSPGQSLDIYKADTCLGGSRITLANMR